MLIRISKKSGVKSTEITPRKLVVERRRFIERAGAALLLAGSTLSEPARAGEKLENIRPGAGRIPDTPTDREAATTYNNFIELGSGKTAPAKQAGSLIAKPWTVHVDGLVAKPAAYDVEDLIRAHELEERVYRLRCVETWSMVIPWVGIPLSTVLKRVDPLGGARFVAFETLLDPKQLPEQRRPFYPWPYREGLRLDEAMHPLTLLAVGMYGEVLPAQNGAPIRLVVPWKYGFKSIKSVVRITLIQEQPETLWNALQPREYGFYANVNPKVDHPRWSQDRERRIGDFLRRDTLPFNGYADEVAHLYSGMDLKKNY